MNPFRHTSVVEWIILIALLLALPWLIRLLFRLAKERKDKRERFGRRHRDCIRVPPRYWKKPDPYVYSQQYLTSLGLEVTWDNPDFRLEQGGVVITGPVVAGGDYEIVVTVHNASTECPAFDVVASFYMHDFGAGDVISDIGTQNIPVVQVQGFGPSEVRCPWKAPARGGHFCLVIKLTCVDDANPFNNEGQHNLTIVRLSRAAGVNRPPIVLPFPITNRFDRELALTITASNYAVSSRRFKVYTPAPAADGEHVHRDLGDFAADAMTDVEFRELVSRTREQRIAENRDGGFPLPQGWRVALPDGVRLAPGERQELSMSLELPPDTALGTYAVTLKAKTADGFLYGGVTTRIIVED